MAGVPAFRRIPLSMKGAFGEDVFTTMEGKCVLCSRQIMIATFV